MVIKELVVTVAILLLAQNTNAKSIKKETEKTDRVIVKIEISEEKTFFVDSTNIGFTWTEAKSLCKAMNMTQVRFETKSKWLSIVNWLGESPYYTDWFWSGAIRDAGSTKWYWEHTGAEIVDFFWIPGSPSMNISQQACMSFNSVREAWTDFNCNNILGNALCEL